MQFQVPQFIETEDKIIGPLTLRQFIYVAAAGGLSALLFFVVQLWLWAILSILFLGIAGSLAFVKIQGRPLTHVIAAALNFYWKPQAYVWRPEEPKAPKPAPEEAAKGKPAAPPDIFGGSSLRRAWQNVQTGTKISMNEKFARQSKERFEVFRRLTGEKQAARRVDYR